ncbi:MAG: glycosyltransferase family protein [Rubricoccaceae bacterium]
MLLVSPARRRPRVALYSHDTCGLGHTRRNLRIAQALAASPLRADVLMLTGARESNAFPIPLGVDLLSLPALYKETDGGYRARHLSFGIDDLLELRSQTLRSSLEAFAPDVFIVDNVPRGAMGELDATLHALRSTSTRCILGLRDVLDDPDAVAREWAARGNLEAIDGTFEEVWVYGDPTVYAADEAYAFPGWLRDRLTYTGYLDPTTGPLDPLAEPSLALDVIPDGPLALCAVGGGQDGGAIARAFAEAQRPNGMAGLILTGPFMDDRTRDAVAEAATQDHLHVARFSTAPGVLYERADRVVAMGGYNTVLELLVLGQRPLIVPREVPRREQCIRADRLAALGLLDVLSSADATPNAIADWLATPARPGPDARHQLDLGGLPHIVALVGRMISSPTSRFRSHVSA